MAHRRTDALRALGKHDNLNLLLCKLVIRLEQRPPRHRPEARIHHTLALLVQHRHLDVVRHGMHADGGQAFVKRIKVRGIVNFIVLE